MMDEMEKLQYSSLRKRFDKNLVALKLLENYYNVEGNIDNTDENTTTDLKMKFYGLKTDLIILKMIGAVSIIFNIILTAFLLFVTF